MGAGVHILAVDDDAALAGFYQDFLEDEGFRVTAMTTLPAGPTAIATLDPDLLLLDLHLAGGDGGACLLEALRAEPATAALPVILVTGDVRAAEGLHPRLTALGVPVVAKPFDLDCLRAAIDTALVAAR